MKNLMIFASGLMGELTLKKTAKAGKTPFVAAPLRNSLRKRDTGDIYSMSPQFQIYEIKGEYFEDVSDILPKTDAVLCIDWKKDYFVNSRPECPVYHAHPSLLPMYRGYGAISEQFARGAVYSGLTVYLDNGIIDAGDIVFQEKIRIEDYHIPADFMENCSQSISNFISKFYDGYEFSPVKQDESRGFYLPRIRKNRLIADFNLSAVSLYNFIRAYSFPFAGVAFFHNNKKYRITSASIESWSGREGSPGEVIKKNSYGLTVACGDGSLLIKEISCDDKLMKADMLPVYKDDIIS